MVYGLAAICNPSNKSVTTAATAEISSYMSTPYQRVAPNANGATSSSSSSMVHPHHHNHHSHRHSHHQHYAGHYESSSQRHNVSYPSTTSYRPPTQQQHHHHRDRGVVVPLHDADRLRYPISSTRFRSEVVVSSGSTNGEYGGTTSSSGGPRYNVRDSSLKRRLFHDAGDTTAAATITTANNSNASPPVPSPAAAAAAAEAAASSSTPMLRAAPFEPLVHERNLPQHGTLSTMSYSRYYRSDQQGNEPASHPSQSRYHHQHHRPDHHGPPRQQSSWDQHHAPSHYRHPQDHQHKASQRAAFEPPMDDSGELRWKRRCYQLQRELNDVRDRYSNLKEEHQRLKRRYTKLEESWILSTQRSNTSNARNSADTFNTGHCVHHRNKKKRRVAHGGSSPVSAGASGSNNDDDGEPDTESKILASAAKAVTEDIVYDDEDDEEEAKLPALVHVPLRADGQIVCHADDEALSDDEGEVDAISLEEIDSEASFVRNHLRNKKKEDGKNVMKSKDSQHHQLSKELVDDGNALALASKPKPGTTDTSGSRRLQAQDVETTAARVVDAKNDSATFLDDSARGINVQPDTVSLNKTKSDDSTSLVAV